MKSRIINFIKRTLSSKAKEQTQDQLIDKYIQNGRIPWSEGYEQYKWQQISEVINSEKILKDFSKQKLENGYGRFLDERIVEYPWLLSNIINGTGKFLDAGSTFNFKVLLDHPKLKGKDTYIYTYYPESSNFLNERISYVFGDLRELPFRDGFFDQIVCHSTLEHIDMDNSMYGYDIDHIVANDTPSFEYLKVISELERVLKPGGSMLLTFPYGKFENHGFFQQFDSTMVAEIEKYLRNMSVSKSFLKYTLNGWEFSTQSECDDQVSYNPHTGKGMKDDGAAHSRAICLLQINKMK